MMYVLIVFFISDRLVYFSGDADVYFQLFHRSFISNIEATVNLGSASKCTFL